jgi:hypothetical protein
MFSVSGLVQRHSSSKDKRKASKWPNKGYYKGLVGTALLCSGIVVVQKVAKSRASNLTSGTVLSIDNAMIYDFSSHEGPNPADTSGVCVDF